VAVFLLIQFIPYGRAQDNPAVVAEPAWDSERTRELAVQACFDCHSNETEWPWYANVAPFSWLITRDVEEGRDHLNFSEWGRSEAEAEEIGEAVAEGEMPPVYYGWIHSHARLSDVDEAALITGLEATAGG
jgi:mono/diheme cytochrome c family protein